MRSSVTRGRELSEKTFTVSGWVLSAFLSYNKSHTDLVQENEEDEKRRSEKDRQNKDRTNERFT